MIDVTCIAFRRYLRARSAASQVPPVDRAPPLRAATADASDDASSSPGASSLIHSGPVVEAGRSANHGGDIFDPQAAWLGRQYGKPIRIGGRVRYTGVGKPRDGTIVSIEGARLRIKLDGVDYVGLYHPTWEIEYLEGPGA